MAKTLVEVQFSFSIIMQIRLNTVASAIACEVLARRVIHLAPPDKMHAMMSSRFRHREVDGDESERLSAIEIAIDSHWYV